jgi:hypothetical protein
MNFKLFASILGLLTLTACSFVPANESPKPRTAEENNAITDSWYPIQSEECQLLVDSMGLVQASIGSIDNQYLIENMDEIKSNLEITGRVVSQKLLELSQNTQEPSIREYALEAIPVYAQLGSLIADDSSDLSFQNDYINKMFNLSGKVPDACKS